jgi:uncharacterized protein (TIGR02145 family)
VKTINISSKRIIQARYKTWIAFLTCLLFLILPSCQKDEPNQDSMLSMNNLPSSASPKNGKISYGKLKDIDGNVYITVKIGKQWWMAENLKATRYNDKTSIANVTDNTEWANLTTGAYCWYNNEKATYINTYGALYNWFAIDAASNGGKNLCPTDWHVPTDFEWHTLVKYLDPSAELTWWPIFESYTAGGKLKETGTIHWENPNEGATNEIGFTALPSGYRMYDGVFAQIGLDCFWRTSSESIYRGLNHNSTLVTRDHYYKEGGLSVRCVKD